jgi:two-component system, NarL family, invasion response regulator UvrY
MGDVITVGLVDDHILLTEALASLIDAFERYKVVLQAPNGQKLKEKLLVLPKPDIILLDISMPEMNGYETALFIRENYPETKIVAVSTYNSEEKIIRMIQAGCRGYVFKELRPSELLRALDTVMSDNYYFPESITGRMIYNLHQFEQSGEVGTIKLTNKEIDFLKLCVSEKTYKEIADIMQLSPKTIDSYRDLLFKKLSAKSRIGLVLYAIKNDLVQL